MTNAMTGTPEGKHDRWEMVLRAERQRQCLSED